MRSESPSNQLPEHIHPARSAFYRTRHLERNRNIVKIYERATPEVRKVLDELMMEICKKPMWELVGFEQPKGG